MAKRAELNDAGGAGGEASFPRRWPPPPSHRPTPLMKRGRPPSPFRVGGCENPPHVFATATTSNNEKKKEKRKKKAVGGGGNKEVEEWVLSESALNFPINPLSLSLSARRWKRWTLKGIDGAKIQSRRERKGSAPFGIGPDDSTPSTVLSTWKSMLKRSFLQHCQRAENDKNTRELGQS